MHQRFALFLLLVFTTCTNPTDTLFQSLPGSKTGIQFENTLTPTEEFNTYTFRNFYNGAGVALGDVNRDGLLDVYFAGNLVDNRLYLNRGDFQFEEVTKQAGVACSGVWSTGVSMADVNGDGWLDLYVCKSGPPASAGKRHNELFINNQDGTFSEQAKVWGIADEGLSVHAVFFDYDKDGDLDAYLLNNSLRSIGAGNDLRKDNREVRDPEGGNKLYRNEGNHFTDVSEEAGIYGSAIGFGLGVTIGDVNTDGWQDIYVSNDFFEKDYLYINQQDGTFQEDLESYIRDLSMGSMGADMADLTNDGQPEIFVTEMLPPDDARYKTKTQFETWDKYQLKVQTGYAHQFGRNVLQLNNGNGSFSEIGRLAGVEATDWSWGALLFDMDCDGYKDIFVANGIYKDLLDQDYVNFYSNPERVRELIRTEEQAILKLVDAMPSQALANYAFRNNDDYTFTNQATDWGLATPSFSNGSAYGDLDNDGDLDLIINNVNQPPFVYKNQARERGQNTLSVTLTGEEKNTYGLGASVRVYAQGRQWHQEQAPMRGFQSCVDHRLHFGLGEVEALDSVVVTWNSGKMQKLGNVNVNQLLELKERDSVDRRTDSRPGTAMDGQLQARLSIFYPSETSLDYTHQENRFSDFDRDRLRFKMKSADGPKATKGDVNGDGLEDLFVCGAKGQAGALFLQNTLGDFEQVQEAIFAQNVASEDSDCLFFDADGDDDLDLYVASGSNEFSPRSTDLFDRLYINTNGTFQLSEQRLPSAKPSSSSCVAAADFDQDGDQDLFVGTRLKPYLYGLPTDGYLLENDGKGTFKEVSETLAPDLKALGLMTDAKWLDADGDQDQDLLIVGEWMPITLFKNEGGKFTKTELSNSNGFWNCLELADIDADGDLDAIIGNHGLNTRLRATPEQPLELYISDFDVNGMADHILTAYNGEESYPLVQRNDLVMQLPALKKKYLRYESYAEQQITDFIPPQRLERATHLYAYEMRSMYLENTGNGLEAHPLPTEAQFSPIHGILVHDFNQDGNLDLLLGGNFHRVKPELGKYDASYGTLLLGNGKGDFEATSALESGLRIIGEVREILGIGEQIFVFRNGRSVQILKY